MRTGSTSASLTILENDNPRGVFEFASVEHIYIHEHDSNYEIDIQRTKGSYERQFVEVRCAVVSVRADSLSALLTLAIFTLHIFYRQPNFPSEPGVANEILENEAKSCLAVA